jgi:endoplasmic reticulum-Golgi intermediate compartment protein 2
VPTIYTEDPSFVRNPDHIPADPPSISNALARKPKTIWTNQYAVTEQSHLVGETMVPGIFVKYDIEPVLLLVSEEMGSSIALLIRLVNVIAGVLVAGGWCYQLSDWAGEVWGRRGGRKKSMGMLHGGGEKDFD